MTKQDSHATLTFAVVPWDRWVSVGNTLREGIGDTGNSQEGRGTGNLRLAERKHAVRRWIDIGRDTGGPYRVADIGRFGD